MTAKKASTDYPIHDLLAERWSPYGFKDRPVAQADLRSLFEAARWAASSYNEQPWNFFGSSGKWGGGDVVGTFRIPNLLPVRLSI